MKRWFLIRHIRYWFHRRAVDRHYAAWAALGMHNGNRKYDEELLRLIWRGEF